VLLLIYLHLLLVYLLLLQLLRRLALHLLLLLPALLALPVECCHHLLVADHSQRRIGNVKVRPEYAAAAVIASGSITRAAGCIQGEPLDAAQQQSF
jgi:4-hydroxybenzoate polyprenyltransferase